MSSTPANQRSARQPLRSRPSLRFVPVSKASRFTLRLEVRRPLGVVIKLKTPFRRKGGTRFTITFYRRNVFGTSSRAFSTTIVKGITYRSRGIFRVLKVEPDSLRRISSRICDMKSVGIKYKPGQRSPNLAQCWRTSSPVQSSRDGNSCSFTKRCASRRKKVIPVAPLEVIPARERRQTCPQTDWEGHRSPPDLWATTTSSNISAVNPARDSFSRRRLSITGVAECQSTR